MNVDIFAESVSQRRRRLAWFVGGAALIVLGATLYLSVQKDWFMRTTTLHVRVDSAKGMVSGMSVKLNGFRIGTLAKLTMDIDGRVSMVLEVNEEYRHLIHKDAKARLVKEDLIGEGVIDLLPGLETVAIVENNALIGFERARDVSDELSKLAIQLEPILRDVKNITAYIDHSDGEIKSTLRELKRASLALADTTETAREISQRNQPRIDSVLDSVARSLNTLDKSLPGLVGKLDSSLQQVEAVTLDAKVISADLKVISAGLSTDIPPAVSAGRDALQDTRAMVHAVKESWPVSNMLAKPVEHSLPLDSYVPH